MREEENTRIISRHVSPSTATEEEEEERLGEYILLPPIAQSHSSLGNKNKSIYTYKTERAGEKRRETHTIYIETFPQRT